MFFWFNSKISIFDVTNLTFYVIYPNSFLIYNFFLHNALSFSFVICQKFDLFHLLFYPFLIWFIVTQHTTEVRLYTDFSSSFSPHETNTTTKISTTVLSSLVRVFSMSN